MRIIIPTIFFVLALLALFFTGFVAWDSRRIENVSD